jgi:hypothetical protein
MIPNIALNNVACLKCFSRRDFMLNPEKKKKKKKEKKEEINDFIYYF